MLKKILPAFTFIALLASCSGIKPLAFSNSRPVSGADNETKKEIKFLDISSADNDQKETRTNIREERTSGPNSQASTGTISKTTKPAEAEKTTPLQQRYSQLLNTDAGQIQNLALYRAIDDWYGTRYKLGGTTKNGIDCSAFVQTIFVSVFGVTLPRTARDQYRATRHISRTELQEGDLLFFNTLGGVSHVGIYLQNNKFVHASVSGVMISDMFEPYYVRHFIAAGRVAALNGGSSLSVNP